MTNTNLILRDCLEAIGLDSLCVMHKDTMKDFVCPVCNKSFTKHQYKLCQTTYCSQSCAYKGRGLGFTKRVVTKPYTIKKSLKRRIERKCKVCGKNFDVTPSRITGGRGNYCCRKCFEISHKERMTGAKNPAYINGSSYTKRSYRGDNWEEIRKRVYERDKWTCRLCFKHCGKKEIQCHHLVPYKISKDNSMTNLITLCNHRHMLIEFGKMEVKCCG